MFVTISSGSKLISSSAAKNKTQSHILIKFCKVDYNTQSCSVKRRARDHKGANFQKQKVGNIKIFRNPNNTLNFLQTLNINSAAQMIDKKNIFITILIYF